VIGRTYLERGQPVTVLVRWHVSRPAADSPGFTFAWHRPPGGAPRNVLVERADGSRTVRPFRGLRRADRGNEGNDHG
jgi:hypothetical protein